MSPAQLMAYWIMEREAMRVRKEYPTVDSYRYGYSNDPHMGLVRYCNVRREDDKVTRWLAQHWRPKYSTAWEIVLARMTNYIPTLEELVVGLDSGESIPQLGAAMKRQRDLGHKIWTSAYTISTAGNAMDKIDYVMGVVQAVREQWNAPPIKRLSDWHRSLTQINGLGSFLAAQVVADMKNTHGHPLMDAPDWWTWSAPGPGSLKGLSAYFGYPVTPRLYAGRITACWDEVRPLLPAHLQDLHMQDFQNCLCEFSKFMRVRGGGHVRNKYIAG